MERNIPIYIYIDIYIYIYTPGMERSRPLLFAFCILCFWCGLSAISNLNTYCLSHQETSTCPKRKATCCRCHFFGRLQYWSQLGYPKNGWFTLLLPGQWENILYFGYPKYPKITEPGGSFPFPNCLEDHSTNRKWLNTPIIKPPFSGVTPFINGTFHKWGIKSWMLWKILWKNDWFQGTPMT